MIKHYHIIQIDDAIGQVQLFQGVLHEALKSHWGIAVPKGHMSKLTESQISHHEGGILLGLVPSCQNLLSKSIVEKCVAPTILSSASCICSSRYKSFLVCALSMQKATQKQRVPSFFQINTTALHHGTGWNILPLHPACP